MDSEIGFMRLPDVLKVIPISKSSWWQGVAKGKYPASYKISKRVTCWKKSDIFALIERLSGEKRDEKNM